MKNYIHNHEEEMRTFLNKLDLLTIGTSQNERLTTDITREEIIQATESLKIINPQGVMDILQNGTKCSRRSYYQHSRPLLTGLLKKIECQHHGRRQSFQNQVRIKTDVKAIDRFQC